MRITYLLPYLLLLLANALPGQQMGTFPFQPMTRRHVANGVIATWKGNHTSATDEVQIYDLHSTLLAHFSVLPLVPEASTVSIWDVAARPGGPIVVAAVSVKPPDAPKNMLMVFGFDGKLQKAFPLAPSRGIERLELDDNTNIWTLTISAGDKPPSEVPLIVEYDLSGREVRTLFTRDAFPMHAMITKASEGSGYASMGYASGSVWAWLPGSADLITVKTASGEASRTVTGLPKLGKQEHPATVLRISDDQYLLSAVDHSGTAAVRKFYMWSPVSKQWTDVNPLGECRDEKLLLGAYDNKPLFLGDISRAICLGSGAAGETGSIAGSSPE